MKKVAVILGVSFVVLAVIVIVFADGLRRYHSGIFFATVGVILLVNAMRRGR